MARSLRTPFVDALNEPWDETSNRAEVLRDELGQAMASGRAHEYLPFTGQSAGLIDEILPAAEIVERIVAEAREALLQAGRLAGGDRS